ncbi:ATP/GTP-binding protein [Streptomyces sp. NPDC003487]
MANVRSSWWARVSGGWERAEGVLTRLLLLGIFAVGLVAQFVTPVGDALEGKAYLGGALLSLVGYVLYAEVQRLNAALRPKTGQLVTPREMEEEFRTALAAGGTVRLATLGFTGETFFDAVKHLLENLPPDPRRTVELRVLVPDFTKAIEFPGLVEADTGKATDAPGFRRLLLDQVSSYEWRLRRQIPQMRTDRRGTLHVGFRVLHMSPSLKLYLINEDLVFEGIYDKIDKRLDDTAGPPQGEPRHHLLDPMGYDSLLTRFSLADGKEARRIVTRRQELFETLWSVARDLTPRTAPPAPPAPPALGAPAAPPAAGGAGGPGTP